MERSDPDSDVGRRLAPRVQAKLYAQLSSQLSLQTAFIESLSATGAGLSVETPPAVGTTVILGWHTHDWQATVVWTKDRRCGLRFAHPISTHIVEALRQLSGNRRLARSGRYVRDIPRAPLHRRRS
jgi:hypothetical protein